MVSSEGLIAPLPPPQAAARQYGVTKPISTAGPTEADIQRTLELEKVCAIEFCFGKIDEFLFLIFWL